jgi:thioredoxin reductase (NADPH)
LQGKLFDAVVIGGGPAGASCTQWLTMLGFSPTLIESRAVLGGLENDDPYPNRFIVTAAPGATGQDIARAIHDNVLALGIPLFLSTSVTAVERGPDGGFRIAAERLDGGVVLSCRNVVLASGVRAVSGGLTPGPRVLIGPGRQVEEAELAGARVAILGGGDNAFENHGLVLRKGATAVRIFARSIRARLELLQSVPPEDVHVGAYAVDPERLTVAGEPFDVILVLYGWEPNLAYASGLGLAVHERGFVAVDAHCRSSVEGVYAIGEVAQRWHPCCVTAMADGVVAAKAIQARLEADRAAPMLARMRRD